MGLSPGQDLLVFLKDGNGDFVQLVGLRSRSLTLRSSTAESTDVESGPWRHLLPGGGLRQASVSGTGYLINDQAADKAREAFFSQTWANWRIEVPGAGRVDGPFHLTSLDISGVSNAETTISLTLISAGVLNYEAIA